ncbi:YfiR family protein [Mariprofundus sp. KV]|uniref:YfiR family protein n=1 Tax=Mariprofundus sp. KV TaxID=2608715 RepID=UPI00188924BF|nr:YfiR family protein [Mariprofundus sp. KV]
MAAAIALFAFSSTTVFASEQASIRSDELKSVYIFNFIRFTDWPEHDAAATGIRLNVLYDQKLHDILQTIADKPAARKLGLKLRSCKEIDCLRASSALYIGEPQRGHFDQLLKLVEGAPVLTISDIPGFAEQGGMIEIKYHNEKLTFIVNLQAVKRAGLYISAQLLQLGEIVGRGNE